MEVFDVILDSAFVLFNFIKTIPSMISQCLGGFPPALVTLLIAGFLVIIAIRILELVF